MLEGQSIQKPRRGKWPLPRSWGRGGTAGTEANLDASGLSWRRPVCYVPAQITCISGKNVIGELFLPFVLRQSFAGIIIMSYIKRQTSWSRARSSSPPSPSPPAASPSTLVTLLEAPTAPSPALLSSSPEARGPARPTHATARHLHEGGKVHLARVHAAARHLLHHHLHLALVHAEAAPTHPVHTRGALRGSRRRAAASRQWRHTRHTARHHLLHLGHLLLLLLDGLAHLLLLQAVRLPGELVEAVVKVVGVILAGAAPELVLLGEVGVEVDVEERLAQRRVYRGGVDVYGGCVEGWVAQS